MPNLYANTRASRSHRHSYDMPMHWQYGTKIEGAPFGESPYEAVARKAKAKVAELGEKKKRRFLKSRPGVWKEWKRRSEARGTSEGYYAFAMPVNRHLFKRPTNKAKMFRLHRGVR